MVTGYRFGRKVDDGRARCIGDEYFLAARGNSALAAEKSSRIAFAIRRTMSTMVMLGALTMDLYWQQEAAAMDFR
ncbi:hypothetical protein ACLOJK_010681 [Asimina triloba]